MSSLSIILLIAGFSLLGFVLSYFIVNEMLFKKFFGKAEKNIRKNSLTDAHYLPVKDEMLLYAERLEKRSKKTFFIAGEGGTRLCADLYGEKGGALIIMAHGLHSVPSYNFGFIAEQAIKRGYDLLVIDQRAHGRSGGKYAYYGKKECEDLLRWIDFAEKELKYKIIFLHGVSMGAAAIGYASDRIESQAVKGGIMDCGFTSAGAVAGNLVKTKHLPGFIFMRYLYIRAKLTLKLDMVNDRVTEHIKNSRIPILFFHGDKDDVAPIEGTETLYRECGAEKRFITIAGAGHTTAAVIGKEQFTEEYFGFIEKYL